MIEELPFDIYQRYKIVERIIKCIKKDKQFSILDVGGFPGYISDFLPKDETYVLDVYYSERPNYIQGNGLKLPFKRDSFDIVTSIDVLEHIPGENRKQFLDELLRVSRDYIILGAPFRNEDVQLSEEIVNNFSSLFLGRENPWLIEHIMNILPDLEETISHFKKSNFRTVDFPNGYLFNWLFMIILNSYLGSSENLADLYRKVNSLYNKNFFEYDNISPSYRRIIFVSKKKKIPSSLMNLYKDSTKKNVLSSLEMLQFLLRVVELRTQNQLKESEDRLNELEYIKSTFSYKFYKRINKFISFLKQLFTLEIYP
jgi:hypothetical protein